MKKLQLGKIQKEWIASLREYPERQTSGMLGMKNDDGYMACCLGEYGLVCAKNGIGNVHFTEKNILIDKENWNYLDSYEEFGLRDYKGSLDNDFISNETYYYSLADMNDGGITWPQIADYVEANPENVFTKSL